MSAFFGFLGIVGIISGIVLLNKNKGDKVKQKPFQIVLIVGIVLFFIGIIIPSGSDDEESALSRQEVEEEIETIEEVTEEKEEAKEAEDVKITEEATMGQKNALKKAQEYLDYSAFSHAGLIEQLKYEGFSDEEAKYAADNCGADWNEQAAQKAQEYLDYSSFSRSGLIDQLKFEGFTNSQAEYGVNAVGY